VTLQVELDERGHIASVALIEGSGSARLDSAARTAVLGWRCNAAMRHGRPTRAVATQSLEFVLDRR
jgi:protein TonB